MLGQGEMRCVQLTPTGDGAETTAAADTDRKSVLKAIVKKWVLRWCDGVALITVDLVFAVSLRNVFGLFLSTSW